MKNYRIYIASAAWLAAMIILPDDLDVLFIAGLFATE